MPAAPPRNPSPARQFSSLRRSISSPNRRPGQSRFGQGQTSHRDPSPAEERPKASISAREASGGGGSSTGKGQRGAGAPAVGDAGFRQSNVKVALRCRPLTARERDTGEVEVVGVAEQTVSLVTGGTHVSADGSTHDDTHVFAFDSNPNPNPNPDPDPNPNPNNPNNPNPNLNSHLNPNRNPNLNPNQEDKRSVAPAPGTYKPRYTLTESRHNI